MIVKLFVALYLCCIHVYKMINFFLLYIRNIAIFSYVSKKTWKLWEKTNLHLNLREIKKEKLLRYWCTLHIESNWILLLRASCICDASLSGVLFAFRHFFVGRREKNERKWKRIELHAMPRSITSRLTDIFLKYVGIVEICHAAFVLFPWESTCFYFDTLYMCRTAVDIPFSHCHVFIIQLVFQTI